MPSLGRLGDNSQTFIDNHGGRCCPHSCTGPAIAGSPNVNANGRAALRAGDSGVHSACCGRNSWTAQGGSATVFINGKPAHRQGDGVAHCGSFGKLISGSPNVSVGG